MPVFVPAAARVRQELAVAIVEGEGAVRNLIGKKILPDFPINRRTAHLIKMSLADTLGLRILTDKYIRSPGTKFERAVAKFGDDQMTVTLRGVEIVVPNETEMDLAGYLDVESAFCGRFGQTSALTQEFLISSAIFSTGTFGAATNSLVAYTFANLATMNPVQDIIASIRRVRARGEQPDTIAMSGPVWDRVRTCTNTLQFVRGTFNAISEVTIEAFTSALSSWGIRQVLVGDGYYNTAADGATPVLTQIWSNTFIWVGKSGEAFGNPKTTDDVASLEGIGVPTLQGVGANIFWEGYTPGGKISNDESGITFEGGNYVESYPDLSIDSMVVRVKLSAQPYIGNARGGDLIATQFA
jgi:hypothetical protein